MCVCVCVRVCVCELNLMLELMDRPETAVPTTPLQRERYIHRERERGEGWVSK